jgi:hypothetical protein
MNVPFFPRTAIRSAAMPLTPPVRLDDFLDRVAA